RGPAQEAQVGQLALAAVHHVAGGVEQRVVQFDARGVDVAHHAHVVAAPAGRFEFAGALDVGDLDLQALAVGELAAGTVGEVFRDAADPVATHGLEAVAAVADLGEGGGVGPGHGHRAVAV